MMTTEFNATMNTSATVGLTAILDTSATTGIDVTSDTNATMDIIATTMGTNDVMGMNATMDTNATMDIITTAAIGINATLGINATPDTNALTEMTTMMAFNTTFLWTNPTAVDNTTGSPDRSFPLAAVVIPEVFAILCSVFGFAGNLLTTITILITPKLKRNANNLFVCNLSVADALFCVFVLPLQAAVLQTGEWVGSDTFCYWFAALKFAIFGAALLSLCAIALNRFVCVVYPQYRARVFTPVKITAMLVICWAAPFILNIPAVSGAWGEYSFRSNALTCTFGNDDNPETDTHGVVIYASFLVVPIVFMVYCYTRIGLVFCRTQIKMKHWSTGSQQSSGSDTGQQGRQLTMSMLAICVLFVLCVGPYTLVGIADPNMKCAECHLITPMFNWIQISFNPVVYTITNSQFQLAYKRLLRRIMSCRECRSCRGVSRSCRETCDCRNRPVSSASTSPTSRINSEQGETAA